MPRRMRARTPAGRTEAGRGSMPVHSMKKAGRARLPGRLFLGRYRSLRPVGQWYGANQLTIAVVQVAAGVVVETIAIAALRVTDVVGSHGAPVDLGRHAFTVAHGLRLQAVRQADIARVAD